MLTFRFSRHDVAVQQGPLMIAFAADGCKRRAGAPLSGRNRSENRPDVTVGVPLLGKFPPQLRLDL